MFKSWDYFEARLCTQETGFKEEGSYLSNDSLISAFLVLIKITFYDCNFFKAY